MIKLDILSHHIVKEFTEGQFKYIDQLTSYVNGRGLTNRHGQPVKIAKGKLSDSTELGLAYTSTSSFAASWICNDELRIESGLKLIGFTFLRHAECMAIFEDENEVRYLESTKAGEITKTEFQLRVDKVSIELANKVAKEVFDMMAPLLGKKIFLAGGGYSKKYTECVNTFDTVKGKHTVANMAKDSKIKVTLSGVMVKERHGGGLSIDVKMWASSNDLNTRGEAKHSQYTNESIYIGKVDENGALHELAFKPLEVPKLNVGKAMKALKKASELLKQFEAVTDSLPSSIKPSISVNNNRQILWEIEQA